MRHATAGAFFLEFLKVAVALGGKNFAMGIYT